LSQVKLYGWLATFVMLFLAVGSAQARAAEESNSTLASASIPADRLKEYADLAVQWEREYLQIDTTNPPGNEMRAATFLKRILDQEGIENQVFEYAPGRADVWARAPHTTPQAQPPIILLSHMDVVTSDAAHWKAPPFSAAILDGSIYGRGAQDMKSEGLAYLMVMVLLKWEKVALNRDVIFLAVSDEEVNDSGTDWFIANHRELLENAGFLINEGGENLLENAGRVKYIGVDVGEKSPFWLHVVAHGHAGHGSRPRVDSAPDRLVRALDRIAGYSPPLKVLPVVDEFLRTMADSEPPQRARQFRNIQQALKDSAFRMRLQQDESLNYLLRDTISLTMMGGSEQTNVIPPEAWANLDVRLLPGEDPQKFLETLRRVVDDPNVSITPQYTNFQTPNYSPTDTELFRAIRTVAQQYFPGTPVAPMLMSGYTESQRFRPLGIVAYGFCPYTATEEEGSTEHGNDERIRVEEVRRGFRVLYDVVMEAAGK
jgi:acetylornithine deacetylase/succinyl-diaminopimelate desuccinylase-like protein